MQIRKDGSVCLPPMWWIMGSVVYLNFVRGTLLIPPVLWFFDKWTAKQAALAFLMTIAFQWIALIALKLAEEALFVRDAKEILGNDGDEEER